MAGALQRCRLVEHGAGALDHAGATDPVVAPATLGSAVFRDGVGAVEGVVQTSPARIGGIQRIARVRHRHHELRPGDAGDLVVHGARADREILRLVAEIPDLAQEGFVGTGIDRPTGAAAVIGIDASLQRVALLQELPVARSHVPHQSREAAPERLRRDSGPRQGLVLDEVPQDGRDPQTADLGTFHEHSSPRRPVPGEWR
jgi:hypothetical protein